MSALTSPDGGKEGLLVVYIQTNKPGKFKRLRCVFHDFERQYYPLNLTILERTSNCCLGRVRPTSQHELHRWSCRFLSAPPIIRSHDYTGSYCQKWTKVWRVPSSFNFLFFVKSKGSCFTSSSGQDFSKRTAKLTISWCWLQPKHNLRYNLHYKLNNFATLQLHLTD